MNQSYLAVLLTATLCVGTGVHAGTMTNIGFSVNPNTLNPVNPPQSSSASCSQLGWTINGDGSNTCGPNGKIGADFSFGANPSPTCLNDMTFGEAKDACENYGARLCTYDELKNGAAAICEAADGYSYDERWVWASTGCTGGEYATYKANKVDPKCRSYDSEEKFYVRCCADEPTPAPTDVPTEAPSPSPTVSPTTSSPTDSPTNSPTTSPTSSPTKSPTTSPTDYPTTGSPTNAPTATESPTTPVVVTWSPTTAEPTAYPTNVPTSTPTWSYTKPPNDTIDDDNTIGDDTNDEDENNNDDDDTAAADPSTQQQNKTIDSVLVIALAGVGAALGLAFVGYRVNLAYVNRKSKSATITDDDDVEKKKSVTFENAITEEMRGEMMRSDDDANTDDDDEGMTIV